MPRKIKVKFGFSKGYLVVDDDKTFLGKIYDYGTSKEDGGRWRWVDFQDNAYGQALTLEAAIERLQHHRYNPY